MNNPNSSLASSTADEVKPARCFALVPCAGSGSRAGTVKPKQYEWIAGQTMVMHTLAALGSVARLQQVHVVIAPDEAHVWPTAPAWQDHFHRMACGGATRAESVFNGLTQLLEAGTANSEGLQSHDWILVHDAARCLITSVEINRLIDACIDDEVGGLLALPLPDTLKSAVHGRVSQTLPRQDKWLAQTPQMFRAGQLHAALKAKQAEHFEGITDEASAMEMAGFSPKLVVGSPHNFKVTYPPDFALAEDLLGEQNMTIRVGEGWDTHALVEGRPLMLGGVQIPHDKGLLGHSDADVLLHAITDALLGAAGLGDIGQHFPDTDATYKGANSVVLLKKAYDHVKQLGWHLGNVDCTIIAQAPKLSPHRSDIRSAIAKALGVPESHVNVKAKTAEKMGPVGEGLSMEARAVVLIHKP